MPDLQYAPDPGAVFASDAHRRTLGHLGDEAMSTEDLLGRMRPDDSTDFEEYDELEDVLQDLAADGHASKSAAGWKMSKKGLDALNGPNGNEP